MAVAKELLVLWHYLHSFPGGTQMAFGVFWVLRLVGALTLGAGPAQAHRLVEGAGPQDCLVLTRLWLSDDLPLYISARPRRPGEVGPSETQAPLHLFSR